MTDIDEKAYFDWKVHALDIAELVDAYRGSVRLIMVSYAAGYASGWCMRSGRGLRPCLIRLPRRPRLRHGVLHHGCRILIGGG